MKKGKGIHPASKMITATCVCGASFETLSTAENINSAICSKCHPFCTGEQKFVDTAGRIEKFTAKFGNSYGDESNSKKNK